MSWLSLMMSLSSAVGRCLLVSNLAPHRVRDDGAGRDAVQKAVDQPVGTQARCFLLGRVAARSSSGSRPAEAAFPAPPLPSQPASITLVSSGWNWTARLRRSTNAWDDAWLRATSRACGGSSHRS